MLKITRVNLAFTDANLTYEVVRGTLEVTNGTLDVIGVISECNRGIPVPLGGL